MKNIEKFNSLIEDLNLTEAQKLIANKISKGFEIQVVNRHHMSGGQMMWKSPYSEDLQHAGKVYKAFFNLFHKIRVNKGEKYKDFYLNFIK